MIMLKVPRLVAPKTLCCYWASLDIFVVFSHQYCYLFSDLCRGGAGISKVVRPLQIKDQSCMCTGGEGLQQAMCDNFILVESKCVGADAVHVMYRLAHETSACLLVLFSLDVRHTL